MTRSGGDFQPRPLKRLFTANQCWTSFLDAGGLRDIEVEAVTKMLACGTRILGVKEYNCENHGSLAAANRGVAEYELSE
uniref:IS91 family transposase n=2 Tax=Escherichia coli TaxID=562 RepID=A0A2H5C082_ECOLX|nr:hypothetical protein PCOV2_00128 [Escherichia coli]AUH16374.1 hypothetical protein PCOV7_00127 [Escherichia coli]AUH18200.1 hypothetical protein PCOV24_00080 [Escherichia coli]